MKQLVRVTAAVLVLVAVIAAPVSASFRGHNGVIAWSYMYNFNEGPTPPGYGIRTVNAQGKAEHTVRSCATLDYCEDWSHVSWSPNGRQLAWDIQAQSGETNVEVADANGTNVVTVGAGFAPSFSPTGQRLIYIRGHGTSERIVESNLHGGDVRKLRSVSGAADPQISPNGKEILFAQHASIWIMNANGGGAHPIIANGKGPDWAPSGSEIAFVAFKSGRVFTALPDGTGQHELPAGGLCDPPQCGGGSSFVAFSPDGRYIAFDDDDSDGDPTVYTMPATGGRPKQVDSVQTDDAGGLVTGLAWQGVG